MKKILLIVVSLILVISSISCGNSKKEKLTVIGKASSAASDAQKEWADAGVADAKERRAKELESSCSIDVGKLVSYASSAGAAEIKDTYEFLNYYLHGKADGQMLETGGYTFLEDEEVMTFFDDEAVGAAFNLPVGYSVDMQNAAVFRKGASEGDNKWSVLVCSVRFEDVYSAPAFYYGLRDAMTEAFKSFNADTVSSVDQGITDDIFYTAGKAVNDAEKTSMYEGLYMKDNFVLMLVGMDVGTKDGENTIESYCSFAGIPSPAKHQEQDAGSDDEDDSDDEDE